MTKVMKKVLREIVKKEVVKIYVCSFNESPHYSVHFHLISRYEYETLMGPELLDYRSKAMLVISPTEKQEIVDKLKEELEREEKQLQRIKSEKQ
jgi:diadenosine tetraphosphate (Ap4A) HIT family hydrolase